MNKLKLCIPLLALILSFPALAFEKEQYSTVESVTEWDNLEEPLAMPSHNHSHDYHDHEHLDNIEPQAGNITENSHKIQIVTHPEDDIIDDKADQHFAYE
ncbi:MAG: hypothetical protein AAF549_02980 [Pseudomonadota bacterium]